MNIQLIGNSKRMEILAKNLCQKGYSVLHSFNTAELPRKITADIVVLPIPSVKNGMLNIEGDPVTAEEVLSRTDSRATVIGCNLKSTCREIIDLNDRDDFAYLNAIPTAEGAINIAISHSDISLFFSNILITGFGRVARVLADRLKPLCRNITIAARSLKDISYAQSLGFDTVNIYKLDDTAHHYDMIFQTVPSPILVEPVLSKLRPDAFIIELSSGCKGTDCDRANEIGISVIKAGGLPEKVAPVSAGNILTESVISIIKEKIPDHTLGE